MRTINEWSRSIHKNAVEHGWWDEPRSFGDIVALCHSELSEALEEYRAGKPNEYFVCDGCPEKIANGVNCLSVETCPHADHSEKPEGIAVEMVDCIIRILDWCGQEDIDVEALVEAKHMYNLTRPYRHGGKKL